MLISASRANDPAALEELLHPDVKDGYGRYPLHHAAQRRHVETMLLILEAGATRDERDTSGQGWTPLLLASDSGERPLHIVVQKRHMEIVRLLLVGRADIDKARTDNGATPLYIAAGRGFTEIVPLLVDGRADIDKARAVDGVVPLYIAVQEGHMKIVCLLREEAGIIQRTSASPCSITGQAFFFPEKSPDFFHRFCCGAGPLICPHVGELPQASMQRRCDEEISRLLEEKARISRLL